MATESAVLGLLQRKGKASIKDMVRDLGVTTNAVREQVVRLQAKGLVRSERQRYGRGRPRAVYSLTEEGAGMFPRDYPALAGALMHAILSTPPEVRAGLLTRASQAMARVYTSGAGAISPEQLAAALESEGVAVRVQAVLGGTVLEECNCPYHDLSEVRREVCEIERHAFSEALSAPVELMHNRWDGYGSCRFFIPRILEP